ncbi:unnamed protein product, partial [Anisakis simplex]|uniref:Polyhomeotic-like protein 1 n=1 Tax=Anisakis simplex TaxID=6269 RepID=A0A0M3JNX0_ANISI
MVAPNNTAQPPQATETESVVHTPVVAVAQVTPIVATQQQHSNSNATTNPIVPMVSEATVLAAVPSQGVVPSSSGPVAPTMVPTASLQQQKPQQQQLYGGFGAQLTNTSTVATSSQQQ